MRRADLKMKPRNRRVGRALTTISVLLTVSVTLRLPGRTHCNLIEESFLDIIFPLGNSQNTLSSLAHSCSIKYSINDFTQQNHSETAFIHFLVFWRKSGPDVKQMQQLLCFLLALFSVLRTREHPGWFSSCFQHNVISSLFFL